MLSSYLCCTTSNRKGGSNGGIQSVTPHQHHAFLCLISEHAISEHALGCIPLFVGSLSHPNTWDVVPACTSDVCV